MWLSSEFFYLFFFILFGFTLSKDVPQLRKRADSCGINGYDHNKGNILYQEIDTKLTTYDCKSLCTSNIDCQSFAVGDRACLLYDIPVQGNLNLESESPFIFYDSGCFISIPSSSEVITSPTPLITPESSTLSILTTSTFVYIGVQSQSSTIQDLPIKTSTSEYSSVISLTSSSASTFSSETVSTPADTSTSTSPALMALQSSSYTPLPQGNVAALRMVPPHRYLILVLFYLLLVISINILTK